MRGRHGFTAAAAAMVLIASLASAGTAVAGSKKVAPTKAAPKHVERKIPVSGTEFIERLGGAHRSQDLSAQGISSSHCISSSETLTLELPSFDPANPGTQNVTFHLETDPMSTGKARIWVAWDFLQSDWADTPDPIECAQIAILQADADEIVDTDVHYFGDYVERPDGNDKIDILTYNIVDELYYDPTFESYIAGFYSSSAQEEFDRNIFFLDSYPWQYGVGDDAEYPNEVEATFAHELEHLIMNDHDADELSWIDEGLADLAIYLNGYGHPQDHVVYFLAVHRNSLTQWTSGLEDYGASYLFQLYLLENFGDAGAGPWEWDNAWTLGMVENDLNGIAGVEDMTDASFKDLFDSWAMANLQDTPGVTARGGFPMGYDLIDLNPYDPAYYSAWSIRRSLHDIYSGSSTHGNLPLSRYFGGAVSGTVEFPIGTTTPYEALYRGLRGSSPGMLVRLFGEQASGVAPTDGTYEVWSGAANELSDRTLALSTPVGGTLTFETWFNIEEEWDYGFVEASTDSGSTWTPLVGSITSTSTNPNDSLAWANALGSATTTDAAITGSSGGWVTATFTLPAASDVLVRFDYFTDEGTLKEGWYIDEVVATTGLTTPDSFEAGSGAWTLGGWEVTTGLFDNDWMFAWAYPTRSGVQTGYQSVWGISGSYDSMTKFIPVAYPTAEPIIVFANRPDEFGADAEYQLFPTKSR